jgi:hypothetical protein
LSDIPADIPSSLGDDIVSEFITRSELCQMVKEIARMAQKTDRTQRGPQAPSRWRALAAKLEAVESPADHEV